MFSFTEEQYINIGKSFRGGLGDVLCQNSDIMDLLDYLSRECVYSESDSNISLVYKTLIRLGERTVLRQKFGLSTSQMRKIFVYNQADDYIITLIGKYIYHAIYSDDFFDYQLKILQQQKCLIPDIKVLYREYAETKGESYDSINFFIENNCHVCINIWREKFFHPESCGNIAHETLQFLHGNIPTI